MKARYMTTLSLAYLGTVLCILGSLLGAKPQNKLPFGCLFILFALSSYYLLNDASFTLSAHHQGGSSVSMSIQYDLQEKGVQTYDLPFQIKQGSPFFFWGLWGLALMGMIGAWIKQYWVSGVSCLAWIGGLAMKLSALPLLNQVAQGEIGARSFLDTTSLNLQNIVAFVPPTEKWQYTSPFYTLFLFGMGCALLGALMPLLQKWSIALKNQGLDQSMGRVLLYLGGICAVFACFDGFASGVYWNADQAQLWGTTMILSVAAFTAHTSAQSMVLSLGAGLLLIL
jgi:hypothetical protein